MAKKVLVLVVLAVIAAGGVFAQSGFSLSAGGGGYFTSDFGGGIEVSGGGQTITLKMPYFGGGGFVFFDATYAEVDVGLFAGGGTMKAEMERKDLVGVGLTSEMDYSVMGLDIGLLGKYPIAMSDSLTVFPLLGIAYRVMLSLKDEDGNQTENENGNENPGDYSALWFRLGSGLDYSLSDKLYLRGEALYGLRLANKVENDAVDELNVPGADAKTLLGHGLEIKLALGYRF
jgi:hypothetical protein